MSLLRDTSLVKHEQKTEKVGGSEFAAITNKPQVLTSWANADGYVGVGSRSGTASAVSAGGWDASCILCKIYLTPSVRSKSFHRSQMQVRLTCATYLLNGNKYLDGWRPVCVSFVQDIHLWKRKTCPLSEAKTFRPSFSFFFFLNHKQIIPLTFLVNNFNEFNCPKFVYLNFKKGKSTNNINLNEIAIRRGSILGPILF